LPEKLLELGDFVARIRLDRFAGIHMAKGDADVHGQTSSGVTTAAI
jgi:hypothetical protein